MKTSFFLFNVDQGQCAALQIADDKWCLFDAGSSSSFSPIEWIAKQAGGNSFHFYKTTISHPHGDHLSDVKRLVDHSPQYLRSVKEDRTYIEACFNTCSSTTSEGFLTEYLSFKNDYGITADSPEFSPVEIEETSLPLGSVDKISSSDNSMVNNASIITRITCFETTILLCGDLEKEGWEYALSKQNPAHRQWINMVSNATVLVAPHHGHQSGYSTELMKLANPLIVLASVRAKDDHVDSRYYTEPKGLHFKNDITARKLLSTRNDGSIRIDIYSPPISGKSRVWTFF